jgi:hypothetical protein
MTPLTVCDVSWEELPLWVSRMGGFCVIKIPYSNAGQGVYTITGPQEFAEFQAAEQVGRSVNNFTAVFFSCFSPPSALGSVRCCSSGSLFVRVAGLGLDNTLSSPPAPLPASSPLSLSPGCAINPSIHNPSMMLLCTGQRVPALRGAEPHCQPHVELGHPLLPLSPRLPTGIPSPLVLLLFLLLLLLLGSSSSSSS